MDKFTKGVLTIILIGVVGNSIDSICKYKLLKEAIKAENK